MITLNKAMVLGRLTRDPEMRYTPNGRAVTNFSVATNRRFKTADGNLQEQTEYHDVVAWSRLAEISNQYLHKGDPVYVDGRLQTRSWEAPDGAKRQKTEIVAENVIVLSPKTANVEPPAVHEAPESVAEDASQDKVKPKKSTIKTESKQDKQSEQDKPSGDDINLDDLPF